MIVKKKMEAALIYAKKLKLLGFLCDLRENLKPENFIFASIIHASLRLAGNPGHDPGRKSHLE